MKKILTSLFALLLLIVPFTITVSATENTYLLDELNLEITLPDGYKVLTRDTEMMDAGLLELLGASTQEVLEQFEKDNLYLDAVSDDYITEITAVMVANNGEDFNEFTDERLDALVSEVLYKTMGSVGIVIDSHEIHTHGQAKYAELRYKQEDADVLQCYTLRDKMAISFVMRSWNGVLSDDQLNQMESILDSVVFDKNATSNEQNLPKEDDATNTQVDDNQDTLELIDLEEFQKELEAEQALSERRKDAEFTGEVIASVIVATVGGSVALIRKKRKEKKENEPVEDEQEWRVDRTYSAVNTKADSKIETKSEETAKSSRYAYCPRCGQQVSAGDMFCNSCGTRIDN